MYYVTQCGSGWLVSTHPRGLGVLFDTQALAEAARVRLNQSAALDKLKSACLDYALAYDLPDAQVMAALASPGQMGLLGLIPQAEGKA